MTTATWNGQVIAESDSTVIVEGNHYFPPSSVRKQFLRDSVKTTICPWKGQASYYTVVVDGNENPNAAWYYPSPSDKSQNIKDHVAFWRGVQIT